jgi:hypothetical protein
MSNKYLRQPLIPDATTETTIYTVPAANTAVLPSLRVTNGNASVAAITVNLYPAGGATAHALLKTYQLPTGQTMDVFSGVPCILEATDVLKVTASVATVTFVLSYLEVDRS